MLLFDKLMIAVIAVISLTVNAKKGSNTDTDAQAVLNELMAKSASPVSMFPDKMTENAKSQQGISVDDLMYPRPTMMDKFGDQTNELDPNTLPRMAGFGASVDSTYNDLPGSGMGGTHTKQDAEGDAHPNFLNNQFRPQNYGGVPRPGMYAPPSMYSAVPPPPMYGYPQHPGMMYPGYPQQPGMMGMPPMGGPGMYPPMMGMPPMGMYGGGGGPMNAHMMGGHPGMYAPMTGMPPMGMYGGGGPMNAPIMGGNPGMYGAGLNGMYGLWGIPPPPSDKDAAAPAEEPPAFKEAGAKIFSKQNKNTKNTHSKDQQNLSSQFVQTSENPMSPVQLPNGMKMNLPFDGSLAASNIIGGINPSVMGSPVVNPMLANAVTGAKLQTMTGLSHAADYYDAHRQIADEQTNVAGELVETTLVATNNEQILDGLQKQEEQLEIELAKAKKDKENSDDRVEKLKRHMKALQLDKKRVDAEYELQQLNDKYGGIDSKEAVEKKIADLKKSIDTATSEMTKTLRGDDRAKASAAE